MHIHVLNVLLFWVYYNYMLTIQFAMFELWSIKVEQTVYTKPQHIILSLLQLHVDSTICRISSSSSFYFIFFGRSVNFIKNRNKETSKTQIPTWTRTNLLPLYQNRGRPTQLKAKTADKKNKFITKTLDP